MNVSADSADTVYRTAKTGLKTAVRIAGEAAEAAAGRIRSVLADPSPGKGKQRLSKLLKDGRECRVFTVPETEKKRFYEKARAYGIPFCVVRDREARADSDVIVRAEDAPRVSRILERYVSQAGKEVSQSLPGSGPDRNVLPSSAPSRTEKDPGLSSGRPSVLDELKEIRTLFERAGTAARSRDRGAAR